MSRSGSSSIDTYPPPLNFVPKHISKKKLLFDSIIEVNAKQLENLSDVIGNSALLANDLHDGSEWCIWSHNISDETFAFTHIKQIGPINKGKH